MGADCPQSGLKPEKFRLFGFSRDGVVQAQLNTGSTWVRLVVLFQAIAGKIETRLGKAQMSADQLFAGESNA